MNARIGVLEIVDRVEIGARRGTLSLVQGGYHPESTERERRMERRHGLTATW